MTDVNKKQYVAGFNLHYDVILQQLIEYLFNEEIIQSDSKWALTQFSILRTLFDYADEVVKGFKYTPEQLTVLIEEHGRLKNKFEKVLKGMAINNQDKMEKNLNEAESK